MDPTNIIASLLITYWFFYMAVIVFMFICMWRIFTKMGRQGWEGIIPIYNMVVLLQTLKKPMIWLLWLLLPLAVMPFYLAGAIAMATSGSAAAMGGFGLVALLFFAAAIVSLVFAIKLYNTLSVSFGYSVWFTLGLILLGVVFWGILAFDNNQFTAPGQLAPAEAAPETPKAPEIPEAPKAVETPQPRAAADVSEISRGDGEA